MDIWSKIRRNSRWDYLLFFTLGLISLTWFKGDCYISGGTFTWHYNFHEYLNTALYVWERMVSTGYSLARMPALLFPYIVYGALFQSIFGNSLIYEKLLFYICFSVSGASSYFLLKILGLGRLPRLVGALFYMLNPFTLLVVWYISIGFYFPFYAFLPLAVGLFVKVLRGEMSFVLANFIIALTPLTASLANPAMFLMFYFVIFSYAVFLLVRCLLRRSYSKLVENLFSFLKFSLLLFLLNLFWLWPFFADLTGQYETASNLKIGLAEDLSTIRLNSAKLFDAFRLFGLWSFKGGELGDFYYPWHKTFATPFFIFLTFVPVVVVLLGFWEMSRSRRETLLFWPLLFSLSLFLIFGMLSPFAGVLEWIYRKFPFLLRAFRGGFTKYGFLYVLAYTVVFSYGIKFLSRLSRLVALLVLPPLLILAFPLFTGAVIFQGGKYLRPYLVEIPEDYLRVKDWDGEVKNDARYLVLPISRADNFSFMWEKGYQGADYLRQFSTHPIVDVRNHPLIPFLAKRINIGKELKVVKSFLSLLNIQNVILRGDARWATPMQWLTNNREKINQFLGSLGPERNFGIFKSYSVAPERYLPHFYVPKEVVFLTGGVEELGELLSFNDYRRRSAVFWSRRPPIRERAHSVFLGIRGGRRTGSKSPWADETKKTFGLDVERKGRYEVFVRAEGGLAGWMEEMEIGKGGERFRPLGRRGADLRETGWMGLGSLDLEEGSYEIRVPIPEEKDRELAVGERWSVDGGLIVRWKVVEAEEGRKILVVSSLDKQAAISAAVSPPNPQSKYLVSFDYELPEGAAAVSFIGEMKGLDTTRDWKHFEAVLEPANFFRDNRLRFFLWGRVYLSVRNLRVVEVFNPRVVFRQMPESSRRGWEPKITFVRINPTKYRVLVEGAREPYFLVFSESFHSGWKAYVEKSRKSAVKSQNDYGEIVASYFDGEVREGTHRSVFLDRRTFETWGRKPIPEERHFLVNGYANSWYVTPEDAEGQENYELVIEFRLQRIFYLGLGVSSLLLVGCAVYLSFNWRRVSTC